VLADIDGPGAVRHVWMTFMPAPPEVMRAQRLQVFYDGAEFPSVSVPCLDFFGMPMGRPVAYASALTAAQEGRGFNSFVPMPFLGSARIEYTNGSERPVVLYYQVDYTLGSVEPAYLHVAFRRENPTVLRRDFAITQDLLGPGRFLGCNIGVRVIDPCDWYGEGEVKIYRDGDSDLPTICGTGLEDYVGSAWGLGPHCAPYAGAPLVVSPPDAPASGVELVGFYRWHLLDPVMFERDLKVTIQQIGAVFFGQGQEREMEAYVEHNPLAGSGWHRLPPPGLAWAITERVDDYCATSYVYCRTPQPVPPVDLDAAVADIARRDYEGALPMEAMDGGGTDR